MLFANIIIIKTIPCFLAFYAISNIFRITKIAIFSGWVGVFVKDKKSHFMFCEGK